MSERHCNAREDGRPCFSPGVYRMVFGDCEVCRLVDGLPECCGHYICTEHTAMLRTNDYRFMDTEYDGRLISMSGDATPVRVTGAEVAR